MIHHHKSTICPRPKFLNDGFYIAFQLKDLVKGCDSILRSFDNPYQEEFKPLNNVIPLPRDIERFGNRVYVIDLMHSQVHVYRLKL